MPSTVTKELSCPPHPKHEPSAAGSGVKVSHIGPCPTWDGEGSEDRDAPHAGGM